MNLPLTNISNNGRELALFYRQDKALKVMYEKTFFPYYYKPDNAGIYRSMDNKRLSKVFVKKTYDIKNKADNTCYEADVRYTRRYLIDKINIDKTDIRYVMFDIETLSKRLPNPTIAPDQISLICVYDNYTDEYKQFMLDQYPSEYKMMEDFINYIRKVQPDLLIAYNGIKFDYTYLCSRFPDFAERISPIGQVIKKMDCPSYPAGITIIDYMAWVKKVYKFKRWSQEYIYCDTFKKEYKPHRYNFSVLSDEMKKKNLEDIQKLVALEKKFNLVYYFDEIRRKARCLWEDLTYNSIIVDCLALQTARQKNVVLPTKPDEDEKYKRAQEEEIEGGYVYAKPGLHQNVQLFDVGGTYPNLIITFNLDPSNKTSDPSAIKIRNVKIRQNSDAIIPSICNELVRARAVIQKEMETAQDTTLLKQKDAAHKSLNNSVYGFMLFKSSRAYDKDIAATITYLARFLIRYTKYYLGRIGYELVANDTDSIFVKTDEPHEKIDEIINKTIIPKWLKHFGKYEGTLKYKYEGIYSSLLILTKKHYCGVMGEKKITKGVEIVRADTSKFTEIFQESLIFDYILKSKPKQEVIKFIQSEIKRIRTLEPKLVAFPCKLSTDDYANVPIFVRALEYTKRKHPSFHQDLGDSFYYMYIKPKDFDTKKIMKTKITKGVKSKIEGTKQVACDVIAFDELNQDHLKNYEIDWDKMIERNIYKKVDTIFNALGWSMEEIK